MSRLWSSRRNKLVTGVVVIVLVLFVTGIIPPKSSTGNDGNGPAPAGNVDWNTATAKTQALFGTSMLSGGPQGDTFVVVLADGFGESGAHLFCSQVRAILTKAGAAADQKIDMRDSKGSLTDCT